MVPPGSSYPIDFTVYAAGPIGGPSTHKEAVITTAKQYWSWLGDIDPGFNPSHHHLEGVDFATETLVAIGAGTVTLGTLVTVDSIVGYNGALAGRFTVEYSVRGPAGIHTQIVGTPYVVVKCSSLDPERTAFVRKVA